MQKHAKKYITPEEYLALEEKAEYKSEYYKGEIFAMAGASLNHNRIARNFSRKLDENLGIDKCEAFMSDIKVWIAEKNLFTYPDVVVVCGKPEFYLNRDDIITNPIIIIEILSESTMNYDRVEKFGFYRSIPTFQEYILVDQYKMHVEHFYMEVRGKWIYTDYRNENDILKFNEIDSQISIKEIYNRVELKKEEKIEPLKPSL